MNRKREEELMQLAFGDLRRENTPLQAQIESDPEAAKTYGSYCEMREGLRALKDIPEMQLSSERLRDAILKEGLSPRRESGWNWSWLATPLAVGACAFVVVTAMRKPATDIPGVGSGAVIGSSDSVATNAPVKDDIFELKTPVNFGNTVNTQADSAPVVKSVVSDEMGQTRTSKSYASNHRRRSTGTRVAALEIASVPGLAKSLSATPPPAPSSLKERKQELMASTAFADTDSMRSMAAPATALDAGQNDIVRIDSKVDKESGAAKAVEVKGSQNVEIGG